ncbi:MAG: permease [Desulfobacterales bacterium]|nr:permease [Desulfobacterales bacterium]
MSTDTPQAGAMKKNANSGLILYLFIGLAGVVLWWMIYRQLAGLSQWLTYNLLSIQKGSHLGHSIEFFLYDTPKVMMLLFLVVFGVGIIRSFFTPEKTRALLSGKSEFAGNVLAALLGIVTPFCSCSAVPLFIGFVTAGVPLGVTFSFLIAAPMVNEIAVGLLYGLLGWKVAAIYMGTGLFIAISAGWVIGRLKLENHIEDWVTQANMVDVEMEEEKLTWNDRIVYGWDAVKEIIGRVWIYVILGIAVGAGIHGFVPEGVMASIMGKGSWWSVPVSVLIGVPMYSNAAGVIPVVEALLGKGAALGSVLAFMMSVIALSLPEMVILRKVLKPRLIAVFVGVVACGILFVGYLFNMIL